jgi:hypothetical protein
VVPAIVAPFAAEQPTVRIGPRDGSGAELEEPTALVARQSHSVPPAIATIVRWRPASLGYLETAPTECHQKSGD